MKKFICSLIVSAVVANLTAEEVNSVQRQDTEVLKPSADNLENIKETALSTVMKVVDNSGRYSYVERMAQIKMLSKTLSSDDIVTLYDFLYGKEKGTLSVLQFNAIKNNVVLVLKSQKVFPRDLGFHLIAMYRDEKFDDVWRDYCIQFLGSTYEALSDDEKVEVQDVFKDAMKYKKKTISGTVLLSMSRLDHLKEFSPNLVAVYAQKLVEDKEVVYFVKSTALQISSKYKNPDCLKSARAILKSKESHSILLMSAIAVVGEHGDVSDKEVLKKLSSCKDSRLRKAATTAVKKLKLVI